MHSEIINGNNALKINYDIYNAININYNRLKNTIKQDTFIPINSNIMIVQNMYLSLTSEENIYISGVKINFDEDTWDFSCEFKDGKPTTIYTYNFDIDISHYYKTILKLFVLYSISEDGIHKSSIKGNFTVIKNLFLYLDKNNIYTIENLTPEICEDFLNSTDVKYNTKIKKKTSIKNFITFYSLLIADVFNNQMRLYLEERDQDTIDAIAEEAKTPLLPSDFYKSCCDFLYEYAMDDSNLIYERSYAALLFIGTQTGLRAGELCILKNDCLEEYDFDDVHIGILKYKSTKNGGTKNNVYTEAKTNANEKTINIIHMLNNLFDYARINTDLLVVGINTNKGYNTSKKIKNELLVSPSSLEKFLKKICIQYRSKLGTINRDDKDSFCTNMDGEYLSKYYSEFKNGYNLKDNDNISAPIIKQFRVYFASELHERGIDYRTISYLLNHKTEDMWGYYVRPKHKVQEDIDFSKEVVAEIVRDNTKILGPKGDAIREKIDEMIKNNQFNVATDLNAIIEMVCNEMPIRAKEGGFCIKSNPRRECRHDANTDEFMCAYGCCPNHCHFYFSASITYQKCLDIKKCMEYNQEQGYKNQSQKEAYKLEATIKHELQPEMKELEKEIKLKGESRVKELHNNLSYLVDNYEMIIKEIEIWQKTIQTILQ